MNKLLDIILDILFYIVEICLAVAAIVVFLILVSLVIIIVGEGLSV